MSLLEKYSTYCRSLLMAIAMFGSTIVFAAESTGKKVPTVSSSVASVILALFVVISIIVVCAWFLKKVGGNHLAKGRGINVIANQMIGAKERLVVIEVDNKTLLLGVTPNSINKIDELSENFVDQQKDESMTFQQAFQTQFKKMMGKKHDGNA